MDGVDELRNVTVIGATNRPDMVDAALLRPGRYNVGQDFQGERILSTGR